MYKKLALRVAANRLLPYRLRKSFVKRICPSILNNHEFEVDFFGLKYTGNTRESADRQVFFFGSNEKHMLYFLRDYVQAIANENTIFIDIGANIGNHSLFMSKYVSHVHAFEPYEVVRNRLQAHISNNHINNIAVHNVGLGKVDESIAYYAPPASNLGVGSFISSHSEDGVYHGELQVVNGDKELAGIKLNNIDIVKIDVEGFERFVIEGLNETFGKFRPLIVVEVSSSTRKTISGKGEFNSLFPKDYILLYFVIKSGNKAGKKSGEYKVAGFDYDLHMQHCDVIACPKEKLHYIKILN